MLWISQSVRVGIRVRRCSALCLLRALTPLPPNQPALPRRAGLRRRRYAATISSRFWFTRCERGHAHAAAGALRAFPAPPGLSAATSLLRFAHYRTVRVPRIRCGACCAPRPAPRHGNAVARPCLTSLRSLRGTPHANCRHYSVMCARPRARVALHARQPVSNPPTTPPAVVERGLVGGYQIETGRKACFVLRLKTPPTPAAREGGASRVQAKGSILNSK